MAEKILCEIGSGGGERKARDILVFLVSIVVVGVIVSAAHWPALSRKSLSFDDEQYLLENQLVQNPGWNSAHRFLTEVLYPSTVRGYYQPLAMISLMADYAMGGRPDNLRPFRITSLALHLANTVLIILLLYQLFGDSWAAALVGLLFGVHPLTVEPIPWLSERKTLLAAFFVLWSLILYVRFCRSGNRKIYFACMASFILALMSKPTSTPLPLLMLLLDYWPLNRLTKKTVVEKIPFFVLSTIAATITFLSQKNTAEVTMPGEYGPMQIPLIVCHNIIFYLYKFTWPAHLSAFYPFPKPFTLQNPTVLAGVIGTAVLLAALLISLRWTRSLLIGWLFFFLAIFPTLGIIGFHPVIAADRHTYLPMVGFLLPLAALLTRFCRVSTTTFPPWLRHVATGSRRHILALAMVLLIGAAEIVTLRRYLIHWCDTVTHYQYMLSLTPDYEVLHNNLALALAGLGRTDEAIEQYLRSLQRREDSEVHNNIGNALQKKGRIEEAVAHYRRAIELTENHRLRWNRPPGFAEAHYNLANALSMQERFDEAVEHYNQALILTPDDADTHYGLGLALAKLNKFSQAIEHYKKAIELKPNFIIAHGRLGLALAAVGRNDEALKEFRIVLSDQPEDAEMHFNVGVLLERQGKITEAINAYQQALQINPDYTQAREYLKAALGKKRP